MVSKIKYAGIFFLTIGYLAKITHFSLGFLSANMVMTVGLLLIAAYALAKLFGK